MKTISENNEMDKVFMAMVSLLALSIVFYGAIIIGTIYLITKFI